MNDPAEDRVTTRIIRDPSDWDSIRADWDALYADSPTASTPLDFAWLRAWWAVYQQTRQAAGLRIVTLWRRGRLVGVVPLYVRRGRGGPFGVRRLGFISTGEAVAEETCPDRLDLLCRPGDEGRCAAAAWAAICELDWDHLTLLDLPEGTPLWAAPGRPGDLRTESRGPSPRADLVGGFEAYLQRLSPRTRQQARRLLREGERAGARLELVEPDRASSTFDELVALHQARWTGAGHPGVFAAPRFVDFHRRLIGRWLPGGRAVLARLSIGPEPLAVLYGFVTGRTFDFYQSGVRLGPSGRLSSPGILAHLLLIRALSRQGITGYDFLRGSAPYKDRLATHQDPLIAAEAWRPTWRTAVHRAIHRVGRGLRFRPARGGQQTG